eukprot:scaffold48_cov161-Amphora_coffeaeformis.AAC.29
MRLAFLLVLIFLGACCCVALSSAKETKAKKSRELQGFNFGQPFGATPAPSPSSIGDYYGGGDGDYYGGGDGDYYDNVPTASPWPTKSPRPTYSPWPTPTAKVQEGGPPDAPVPAPVDNFENTTQAPGEAIPEPLTTRPPGLTSAPSPASNGTQPNVPVPVPYGTQTNVPAPVPNGTQTNVPVPVPYGQQTNVPVPFPYGQQTSSPVAAPGSLQSVVPVPVPLQTGSPTAGQYFTDAPVPVPEYPNWNPYPEYKRTPQPTARYVPPNDDFLENEQDDKIAKEWEEKSNLEKVEAEWDQIRRDKNVKIVSIVFGVTGFLLIIFVAHQLIENPDGCFGKICRCTLACIRIFCWPCRAICCRSARARDRRTHQLVNNEPGTYGYSHDLELT